MASYSLQKSKHKVKEEVAVKRSATGKDKQKTWTIFFTDQEKKEEFANAFKRCNPAEIEKRKLALQEEIRKKVEEEFLKKQRDDERLRKLSTVLEEEESPQFKSRASPDNKRRLENIGATGDGGGGFTLNPVVEEKSEFELLMEQEIEREREQFRLLEEKLKSHKEKELEAEKRKQLEEQEAEVRRKFLEEQTRKLNEQRKKEEKKREAEREEELKRKREQEEQERLEKLKKLENSWEYRFNQLWEAHFNSLSFSDMQIRSALKIFEFMGDLHAKAVRTCKDIIDDLSFPKSFRNQYAIELGKEKEGVDKESREKMYFVNNFIIKVTWCEHGFCENEEGADTEQQIYTQKLIKSYGHEFRAAQALGDQVFEVNKKARNLLYRIPMYCLVDYKGFRCLVTSTPPLNGDSTLVHGLTSEGVYKIQRSLIKDLRAIAGPLNLKEHIYMQDTKSQPVQVELSIFAEVHRCVFSDDNANSSPRKDGPKPMEVHYIMKTAEIFPVDADLESPISFIKRLRPEFLIKYGRPLSADGFLSNAETDEVIKDDLEVKEAAKELREEYIKSLIEDLQSLKVLSIDSESVTEAFHKAGINMRYLELVRQQATAQHIRDICLIEMIARSAKKIFRKQIAELMHNFMREIQKTEKSYRSNFKAMNRMLGLKRGEGTMKEAKRFAPDDAEAKEDFEKYSAQVQSEKAECVVDFLNLLFGKGPEPDVFWAEILSHQIHHDFNCSMNQVKRQDLVPGLLYYAVVHHCGLEMTLDEETLSKPIGSVVRPFTVEHFKGFKVKSRIPPLSNLDLRVYCEKYQEYREKKSYDLSIKACQMKMAIEKALSMDNEVRDPNLLADMAEIYFDMNDIPKALERADASVNLCRKLHAECVKPYSLMMKAYIKRGLVEDCFRCFDNALKALKFHLGPLHPLHTKLYQILGKYYIDKEMFQDALLLYNSRFVSSVKVLGPNHLHTGEAYKDLAYLLTKMGQKEEALQNYIQAYQVYEILKKTETVESAHISLQIASLQLALGKMKDAKEWVMKSIGIYLNQANFDYNELIECYWVVCLISEIVTDFRTAIEYSEKIFILLEEKEITKKELYQDRALTITLNVLIASLTVNRKTYLYLIFDAIADYLNQRGFVDKTDKTLGDEKIKAEYLEKVWKKCQQSGKITNYLKEVFAGIFQHVQEKDIQEMNENYLKYYSSVQNEKLKIALDEFQNLVWCKGLTYFYERLKKLPHVS